MILSLLLLFPPLILVSSSFMSVIFIMFLKVNHQNLKELSSSSFKSLPPVRLCSIVFEITARCIEAIFSKDKPQSNAKFMSNAKTKERGDPFERDDIKSR